MNDNTVYVIDARRYSRNGEIIEHNVHAYSSYQNIIAAFKPFFEVPNKEVHMNGKNEMLQVRIFDPENEFVTKDMKAYDYTNYEIPLKKGDTVKEVFAYQDKVQIKKNGILGWTYRSNLE